MFRKKLKKDLNKLKQSLIVSEQYGRDEYMTGYTNGIEYVLSILENRKPEYLKEQEEEVLENFGKREERAGRTVSCGIIRR